MTLSPIFAYSSASLTSNLRVANLILLKFKLVYFVLLYIHTNTQECDENGLDYLDEVSPRTNEFNGLTSKTSKRVVGNILCR